MKSLNGISKTIGALALGFVCFATANAQAESHRTSTGASLSTTTTKPSTVTPDAHPATEDALPAGASVIYSNLGTGTSVYDGGTGWTEAGKEANDFPIAEAMSFTPTSNFVLLRIDAALTYVQGTNGVRLILAEDNNGVPGKAVYITSFTNLPAFGTCCVLQTAKLTPSKSSYVELKGGQTYWLWPLPADSTSYLVWNLDTTNQSGNGAVSQDYGRTWNPAPLAPFGAFDLYGVKVGQ